jgi:hypothetical protein
MRAFLRWMVVCAACLAGAVLLFEWHQPSAFAQKSASDVDKARGLMEEGQSLFKQGLYKEAMEKFEEAYRTHAFSAFLYNAALAAEKSGDLQRAIARYNEYLASDPESPYTDQVKTKVAELQAQLSKVPIPEPGGDGGGGEGGAAANPEPQPTAPIPADAETIAEIRSLVLVESEPAGAPISIYERVVPTAAAFNANGDNPGWREIVKDAATPKDLSLKVGHYHIVIDKFQDYNRSETDINLAPGHVYTFKANLSQGAFLGALLLKTNVEHAKVFVDDPPPHKSAPLFRGTDTRDLNKGEHQVWVEAPGYEPVHKTFKVEQGQTTEVEVTLARVGYGYLIIDGNAEVIEIEIDGKVYPNFVSTGDPVKIKLEAGKHRVVLDADGRNLFEGEVEVPKGQELPLHATLTDIYPREKAAAFAVLSGLSLGGGIALHVMAEKPYGDDEDVTEDAHNIYNITRYAAFGASGVFAVLCVVFSIYDPTEDSLLKFDDARDFPEGDSLKRRPKTQKSARAPIVVPLFSPEIAGVGIFGRF